MSSMQERKFAVLVEECLRRMREHVTADAGQHVREFLNKESDHVIASRIVDATSPAVSRLLTTNDQDMSARIIHLAGPIDDKNQGVFADILMRASDKSATRIFVGAAVGPYRTRRGGIRDRITDLQAEMRRQSQSTIPHFQLLRSADWCAHWAVLASFKKSVEKEMVLIAQAIMMILLGSYPNHAYLACRPEILCPLPLDWGLNETNPLRIDGLASYYKNLTSINTGEATTLRKKILAGSRALSSTAARRRRDRLQNGGAIRVYVLESGGRVTRFHVTLMTATDGAHVDIVIPLLTGLEYGLQISRTVDIKAEVSTRNHSTPFAAKSPYNSEARRLGIMMSGTRTLGPQRGAKFTHWLRSPKKAAVRKAEKLMQFLGNRLEHPDECSEEPREFSKFVVWSEKAFLNAPGPSDRVVEPRSARFASQPPCATSCGQGNEDGLYEMILRLTKSLQQLSLSWSVRASPSVRSYFAANASESIATDITRAVRPPVQDFLLSPRQFTSVRLLSLGGDIRDSNQGVYADIVTYDDGEEFKIYVGAAGSTGKGSSTGLRRRIREHLRFAELKSGHAQSGVLHYNEIRRHGAHTNFVVLVRFAESVQAPLVHIAEALMSILFASWDNKVFNRLRPSHLAGCPISWGLNKANPLDFAIVPTDSYADLQERRRQCGLERARRNQIRRIENARTGCYVQLCVDRRRNDFRFYLCRETILIPTTVGRALGLKSRMKIRVDCDVQAAQHPSAYAQRAPWTSNSRRLGICITGTYSHGSCKGQEFKKWIECGSEAAVTRAERIILAVDN